MGEICRLAMLADYLTQDTIVWVLDVEFLFTSSPFLGPLKDIDCEIDLQSSDGVFYNGAHAKSYSLSRRDSSGYQQQSHLRLSKVYAFLVDV